MSLRDIDAMRNDNQFKNFEEVRDQFRHSARKCQFLLVDLIDSTAYKSQNEEINWLTRLKRFYDTTLHVVQDIGNSKLLGDAVLVTCDADKVSAEKFASVAEDILAAISNLNADFPAAHKINIRIIISCGNAYKFSENDPQGSAVDKLFRMEKFVPDNCIGMTEEFARDLGMTTSPIARFPLKGLPIPATHGLHLLRKTASPATLKKLLCDSYLAELWGLHQSKADSKIVLVGGHIPDGSMSTVQMGDVNAKLMALRTLAKLGYADELDICDSSSFQNSAYSSNIVSIGGPCFNGISERLISELPIGFEVSENDKDETPIISKCDNQKFSSQFSKGRITIDYGLFARMKNPFNAESRVIVACGIESPAVEGIIQAFTHDNPHFIDLVSRIIALNSDQKTIPDFCCVMRIPVEMGHVPRLPPLTDQLRNVFII